MTSNPIPQQAGPGEGADIGIVCPTAPERIWLQVDPEPEVEGMPVYPTNPSVDDVSWCWDKINNTDTLYIRADLAAPLAVEDSRERCASSDAARLEWLSDVSNLKVRSRYMDPDGPCLITVIAGDRALGHGYSLRGAVDAAMAAASSGEKME